MTQFGQPTSSDAEERKEKTNEQTNTAHVLWPSPRRESAGVKPSTRK